MTTPKKKTTTATSSPYSVQYKNPKWQKKRLEILERDNFQCQECGDEESTLHVHHKIYKHGNKVWDYDDQYFVTLCDSCHENTHELIKNFKLEYDILLMFGGTEFLYYITEILGFLNCMTPDDLSEILDACYVLRSINKEKLSDYRKQTK